MTPSSRTPRQRHLLAFIARAFGDFGPALATALARWPLLGADGKPNPCYADICRDALDEIARLEQGESAPDAAEKTLSAIFWRVSLAAQSRLADLYPQRAPDDIAALLNTGEGRLAVIVEMGRAEFDPDLYTTAMARQMGLLVACGLGTLSREAADKLSERLHGNPTARQIMADAEAGLLAAEFRPIRSHAIH